MKASGSWRWPSARLLLGLEQERHTKSTEGIVGISFARLFPRSKCDRQIDLCQKLAKLPTPSAAITAREPLRTLLGLVQCSTSGSFKDDAEGCSQSQLLKRCQTATVFRALDDCARPQRSGWRSRAKDAGEGVLRFQRFAADGGRVCSSNTASSLYPGPSPLHLAFRSTIPTIKPYPGLRSPLCPLCQTVWLGFVS